MIFARPGPSFLFLRSNTGEKLKEYLETSFGCNALNLLDAFELAGEHCTIVFITPPGIEKTIVESADYIIPLPGYPSSILSKIINDKASELVDKSHLGPALLIMRIPRNGSRIIDRISQEYQAMHLSLEKAINEGESPDTILTFVEKSINRVVPAVGFTYPFLLINKPLDEMQRNIRRDAVIYITEGLENTQWFELRINIYDGEEYYLTHVERLNLVFTDLEVGMVLGETWTRDQAFVLMSVVAYQIRMFTLMAPQDVKKLLVGLEYDHRGIRFVDMDLYYRNKKVEWASIKELKEEGRAEGGLKFREHLLSRLSEDARKKLIAIEENMVRDKSEKRRIAREKMMKKENHNRKSG